MRALCPYIYGVIGAITPRTREATMAFDAGPTQPMVTWNPVTGCTKLSAGCRHCYAERMAVRLQAMGQAAYATGFELGLHREKLRQPLEWKKPSTIFVNSMSDLFHEDIPVEFIQEVFATMREASWHRFQILTKRAERLEELDQ